MITEAGTFRRNKENCFSILRLGEILKTKTSLTVVGFFLAPCQVFAFVVWEHHVGEGVDSSLEGDLLSAAVHPVAAKRQSSVV